MLTSRWFLEQIYGWHFEQMLIYLNFWNRQFFRISMSNDAKFQNQLNFLLFLRARACHPKHTFLMSCQSLFNSWLVFPKKLKTSPTFYFFFFILKIFMLILIGYLRETVFIILTNYDNLFICRVKINAECVLAVKL